jgi:DNA end-binding protein Ku
MEAMRKSNRCALAKWAWKGKQYVVQVRPGEDGLVLQQLLYADEVRSMKDIQVEHAPVSQSELALALQLIEQNAVEDYDPTAFKDEEKERIKAAIDEKIEGKQIVVAEQPAEGGGAQVIDLMDALRASLGGKKKGAAEPIAEAAAETKERKGPKRAAAPATEAPAEAEPAPKRARAARK